MFYPIKNRLSDDGRFVLSIIFLAIKKPNILEKMIDFICWLAYNIHQQDKVLSVLEVVARLLEQPSYCTLTSRRKKR
ncbi:hypothetical protein CPI38_06175 [Moraxella catarrhalis]|nr:hypothetical protein [Moraxella catarrhalis]